MITIISILISILILSQVYLFYLYINKINKHKDIKKGSIILKPIPDKVKIDDVEGVDELLHDVLLSCKNENWSYTFKEDPSYGSSSYKINITSNDKLINIRSFIRNYYDSDVKLVTFSIKSNNDIITFDDDSNFKNDIIVFLYDYIITERLNENSETTKSYKNNFENIRKNLISLNRNNALDKLLKK